MKSWCERSGEERGLGDEKIAVCVLHSMGGWMDWRGVLTFYFLAFSSYLFGNSHFLSFHFPALTC